jgi:N-acetylglucosaminyldiphosphoundecaprenol N-acetyl-beta-D-mannosaminyltransferase
MESQRDPAPSSGDPPRAAMVTPDGSRLVWLGGVPAWPCRSGLWPDLMLEVCGVSNVARHRHFLRRRRGSGRAPGERLRPLRDLAVVGTLCPPFRPLSEERACAVAEGINAAAPISSGPSSAPRTGALDGGAGASSPGPRADRRGSAFDFPAGVKRQGAAWLSAAAFEWAFASPPSRAALARYLKQHAVIAMPWPRLCAGA